MRTVILSITSLLGFVNVVVGQEKKQVKPAVPEIAKTFTQVKVTTVVEKGGKKVRVQKVLKAKKQIRKLASFFPELGSGKPSGIGPGGWGSNLSLEFKRTKGKPVVVLISVPIRAGRRTFRYWFDGSVGAKVASQGADRVLRKQKQFEKTLENMLKDQ